MTTFNRKLYLLAQKLLDLAAMGAAFGAAFVASWGQRAPVSLEQFLGMRIKVVNFLLFLGFLSAWNLLFLSAGLYRSRRLTTFRREALDVVWACTAGTLLIGAVAWAIDLQVVGAVFLAVFWAFSIVLCTGQRLLFRASMRWLRRRGRNLRFLLIAGTNDRAVALAREIERRPELGYRLVGFADREWPGLANFRNSGYELVCGLDDLGSFLLRTVVDEVLICLPLHSLYERASSVVRTCQAQGVVVRYSGRVFDLARREGEGELLSVDPIVTVSTGLMEGWPGLVKRGLDLLLGSVLLLAALPLLAAAALAIRLTSPGPILFSQERVGLNKRVFRLWKLRTMVVGAAADELALADRNRMDGPVFKVEADPRITPVERILRRFSLVELPQLVNVLKGEMSLVGPRPLPVEESRGLPESWQARRLSVRPGLTGLWQVSGRNLTGFDRWMELDMAYIDQWSLLLDLRLLGRTLLAVIRGTGAM